MDITIVQYDAKKVHIVGKKGGLDYFSVTLYKFFHLFCHLLAIFAA